MRRLLVVVFAIGAVALAPSCASIVGVEPIPDVDGSSDVGEEADGTGQGDGPSADAPPDVPGVSDGRTEAEVETGGGDGQADAPSEATDGRTDASDAQTSDVKEEETGPSCSAPGWACVPAVPQGFAYELVDRTDTAGCPTGLSNGEVVASATGSPASCSCTCGIGQEPSCTYGNLTANVGSMSCSEGAASYVASGGCVGSSGVSPMFLQAASLPPSGGSCTPSVGKSVPSLQETKWRTCAYAGGFTGGCPAGQVCAPVATGFSSCVTIAGNVSCPTTYPDAGSVGTGVSDTRDCGSCSCAAPTGATCSNATLTFYVDGACSSAEETANVDDTCNTLAGSTYLSYRYAATASASCGGVTQQPSPTGGVSLTGTTTVCCSN